MIKKKKMVKYDNRTIRRKIWILYEKIRIATLNGDYISGNRAEKEKRKLYNKLSQDEELTINVLESLLKSPNVVARISAASYLLKLNVNVKFCLKMLKEISKNKEYGIFCWTWIFTSYWGWWSY